MSSMIEQLGITPGLSSDPWMVLIGSISAGYEANKPVVTKGNRGSEVSRMNALHNRRIVLAAIKMAGEGGATIRELSGMTGLSRETCRHHATALADDGLVVFAKRGCAARVALK